MAQARMFEYRLEEQNTKAITRLHQAINHQGKCSDNQECDSAPLICTICLSTVCLSFTKKCFYYFTSAFPSLELLDFPATAVEKR